MKSYAKKIMTRLAAGAMALLLAVGTAATDMSVYEPPACQDAAEH